MGLYLEVIAGDQQGTRFPIAGGKTVGRRNADIVLRDSKVSALHARIEERPGIGFFLIDNKSANGLKVHGQRLQELFLTPGARVQIGRTTLKVVFIAEQSAELVATASSETPEPTVDDEHSAEIEIGPVKEDWHIVLERLAQRGVARSMMDKREINPFNPPLTLKFIQGIQLGEEWLLGYGPRELGSETIELVLEEQACPAVCFEVAPDRAGARFKTDHPEVVRLNGKKISEEILHDGDVIQIKNTMIEIKLKES